MIVAGRGAGGQGGCRGLKSKSLGPALQFGGRRCVANRGHAHGGAKTGALAVAAIMRWREWSSIRANIRDGRGADNMRLRHIWHGRCGSKQALQGKRIDRQNAEQIPHRGAEIMSLALRGVSLCQLTLRVSFSACPYRAAAGLSHASRACAVRC